VPEETVEHFTAPDGTRLAYHLIGSGPAVVCIPGGPGRASAYLEDLAGLAQHHTLVRFDLRGTGRSELPLDRESLTFPRLADDVEALRVARGLDSVDLVAHSAGCFVALTYAARHPDRVSRLVLVTPSGRGFGAVMEDVRAIRASRSHEPWYAEAAAVEAEVEMYPPHKRDRPHRELRVFGYGRWDDRAQAHAASTDVQMSLRAMAGFGPGEDFDGAKLVADLQQVIAPTLVIVGRLDGMTGVKAGHLIADMLPNSRVVEIDEASHFPWVDAPEEFGTAAAEFLA
jgi:pimeloyl-ACP methyl ester carboxylesterase